VNRGGDRPELEVQPIGQRGEVTTEQLGAGRKPAQQAPHRAGRQPQTQPRPDRWPAPAALAASAAPITSARSRRRRSPTTGSSTCVARHALQRARRRRSRCCRPPRPRSHRPRAQPHPPNTPAQPGQANSPAASACSTRPGSVSTLSTGAPRTICKALPCLRDEFREGLRISRRAKPGSAPATRATTARGTNSSLSSSPPSVPLQALLNPNERVGQHPSGQRSSRSYSMSCVPSSCRQISMSGRQSRTNRLAV